LSWRADGSSLPPGRQREKDREQKECLDNACAGARAHRAKMRLLSSWHAGVHAGRGRAIAAAQSVQERHEHAPLVEA
jgi:hypothetical protein